MAEGIPGGSSSEPVTPQDTSGFIECKRPTYIYIFFFYIGYFSYAFISLFIHLGFFFVVVGPNRF